LVFLYARNLLRKFVRGSALKESEIAARSELISLAFEQALRHLLSGHCMTPAEFDLPFARLAVKASHYQCGPVARAAEAILRSTSIDGVKFHFTGFHYGLLDTRSGLFYDLETPHGCSDMSQLPVFRRTQELDLLRVESIQKDFVFEKYAQDWLSGRYCDPKISN
jgi:hypothetical protein